MISNQTIPDTFISQTKKQQSCLLNFFFCFLNVHILYVYFTTLFVTACLTAEISYFRQWKSKRLRLLSIVIRAGRQPWVKVCSALLSGSLSHGRMCSQPFSWNYHSFQLKEQRYKFPQPQSDSQHGRKECVFLFSLGVLFIIWDILTMLTFKMINWIEWTEVIWFYRLGGFFFSTEAFYLSDIYMCLNEYVQC